MMSIGTVTFASPLGSWDLSIGAASSDLETIVDAFWSVRGRVSYRRETILPTDRVELMFNLGRPHRVIQSRDGGGSDFERAWVSGLQEGPLVVEPQYDTSRYDSHLLAVRLQPQGAHALFGLPMVELSNRVIEVDEALLPGAGELAERLFGAASLAEQFGLLQSAVRRRLQEVAIEPSARVERALDAFRRAGGLLPVQSLCDQLDITRKHLSETFRREVGLTPKRMARIMKFTRVVEHLKSSPEIRWAELALDFGYFDQSHFNREFRAFTGTTPSDFLRTCSADGSALIEGTTDVSR